MMSKNSQVQSEFHELMSSLSHELNAKLIERPGLKNERDLLNAVEILKEKSYVVHIYDCGDSTGLR